MTTYATTRGIAKRAGYDRILVDGVDVTYFRDKRTPTPGYLLTEPFAYGSMTLQLPQVHAYEALATGDLSWVRKGAPVTLQRVDDPTAVTPTVLATDYRGYVISVNIEGRSVSLEVGGQFAGRAALINRQPPLFRRLRDVGFWAAYAIQSAGLSISDRDGPTTGIETVETGGTSLLAWASEMCALSQDDAGLQRTIMPDVWGGNTWGFPVKDYDTVHLTLRTDDARAVVSLRDDLAEQPNTWFGTGITPDGVRVRNGRYPGLIQGPAPEYPNTDSSSFGLGDVDADTDSGDGVTVLNHKLAAMGFVSITETFQYSIYSAATVAAVKEIQRRAGLTVNGTTNPATWDAVFDLSATGFSFTDARIHPLVQDDDVRPHDYTANGSVAGLNPFYDPGELRVDRNVDFGAGIEKAQMVAWCLGQSTRLAGKNWAGTIRLGEHVAALVGEVADVDLPSLTDADVMPLRDIRPGMNAWLPFFDGGTLVHISGVQIDDGGLSGTLTVDTQARDLLELSEVIARRRESQRDIRREWMVTNRSRKPSTDMVTWDEFGGRLTQNVALDGDKWTVIPVVAGQTGTVNRIKLQLRNDEAAFCVAVFGREVTRKKLQRRVGNPFPLVDGESVWETNNLSDWYERGVLLYAAGDEDQPCGYWPRKHTNNQGDTTAHPITGDWQDDAGFPYITGGTGAAVLYVAIYPDRDTVLQRGQILYKLEDDAV